jgi:hypothetical protein
VALKIPINSYPESTGLALLALQGRARDIGGAVRLARTYHNQTTSPLARAWLSIALQAWGDAPAAVDDNAPPPGDIMLAALQAIAHPFGNHELLRTAEVV